ncbi:hypothetical protein [Labilibacter marinus]|uniref:hypothetical protein n=1 Tax=Labilibacter marinus TaxID=1477105 RepID=UPI00082BE1DC|nr:hypothetical protein [Labilibacter marinus]
MQQRLDRQRLIFDSILLGISILAITIVIRKVAEIFIPEFIQTLHSYLPLQTPYIGTTIFSFIFSVAFTELGNLTFCSNHKKQIEKAIKKVGNELEILLRSSFKDSKLLEFTLDNNKVYIAWVKELPIPTVSNYIRVIPVLSGYRNEQRQLNFTTHYLSVYSEYVNEGRVEDVSELDVDLILTLDNLVSVSYFDIGMYERFNSTTGANNM